MGDATGEAPGAEDQVRRLNARIEELEQHQQALAEKASLQADLRALHARLEGAEEQRTRLARQLGELTAELAQRDEALAKTRERLLIAEATAANASAAGVDRQIAQLELKLETMTEERDRARAEADELREAVEARDLALKEFGQQLVRARVESAGRDRPGEEDGAGESSEEGDSAEVIVRQRQQIAELESHLRSIAAMVSDRPDAGDPGQVLRELGARLDHFERLRDEQQGAIDRLSRSLAVQEVDSALEESQTRMQSPATRVERTIRRAQLYGVPLTCLMIGIDDPEGFRQRYESVFYDFVLVQIAQRLKRGRRGSDLLKRQGDHSFVMLTDAEEESQARGHAERIMRTVCDEPLEYQGTAMRPSISIVFFPYRPELGAAADVVRYAREQLERVQARGRRQIAAIDWHPPESQESRS